LQVFLEDLSNLLSGLIRPVLLTTVAQTLAPGHP